jgi:hypothetical protein
MNGPGFAGAFFIPGREANSFAEVDGDKQWRTKCGASKIDLKPPPKGSQSRIYDADYRNCLFIVSISPCLYLSVMGMLMFPMNI